MWGLRRKSRSGIDEKTKDTQGERSRAECVNGLQEGPQHLREPGLASKMTRDGHGIIYIPSKPPQILHACHRVERSGLWSRAQESQLRPRQASRRCQNSPGLLELHQRTPYGSQNVSNNKLWGSKPLNFGADLLCTKVKTQKPRITTGKAKT